MPRGVAAAAGSICQAAAVLGLSLRGKRSSGTEHTSTQIFGRANIFDFKSLGDGYGGVTGGKINGRTITSIKMCYIQ